jgi:hypothetical protein
MKSHAREFRCLKNNYFKPSRVYIRKNLVLGRYQRISFGIRGKILKRGRKKRNM